ncbi:uncharacterized protein A4U43_C03F13490 [Asparagus officinalis]|uniref:Protein kinase domain-containing protein n=1 Tax=Asparagus officinalis TaxID=4686 RepID=A0A5P1FAB9_ASPOF|nr:uncharacterized protein A4U43_C03F13490 [Asparagus officinalis]
MIAHVGDFGLAKFLENVSSQYLAGSTGLKGTIGYIAPGEHEGAQSMTTAKPMEFVFSSELPVERMEIEKLLKQL